MNSTLHKNGIPSEDLLKICYLTGLIPQASTLQAINTAAQEGWIRKPSQERWDIEKKHEAKRTQIVQHLYNLGLIAEKKPQKKSYDYIVILGGTTKRCKKRIDYTANLYKLKALSGGTIVLLTGERPLNPQVEAEELKLYNTETEVMTALLKQSLLKEQTHLIVSAPMKNTIRPTTDDTVVAWLKQQPKPGSVLVVSDQPFIKRQTAVLRRLLPSTFTLEEAGAAASDDLEIAIHLDELARTIFEENKQLTSQTQEEQKIN